MNLTELGKRAVACKHWRWVDGSKRVHPEHRWAWRLVGWRWFPCDERSNDVHDDVFKESLPDFSDPATLGCLLALVEEAWKCPADFSFDGAHWADLITREQVWLRDGDHPFEHKTRAGALVAALEAAP